ncbi:MAG: hypothetical protein JOZ87_30830 [Chloroflexi bacterium]|nr:hypothetical protein [Chloroflexota bacterium]
MVLFATPMQVGALTVPKFFHPQIVRLAPHRSRTWSGYNQGMLEKGTQFHQVAATWTVPTATQHTAGEAEFSATWVGIGGGCIDADCTVTDGTLIQAGTEQNVTAAGRASYSAWWELIPAASRPLPVVVSAGDSMYVAITEVASSVWTITAQNQTTGQSYSLTTPYTSTYATAEWIVERPSAGGVSNLPSLSTVHFDMTQTNGGPAGLVASEELQMLDSKGTTLAEASAPDGDIDGFNICTFAETCAAPVTPKCVLTGMGTNAQRQNYIQVTVQDTSGLQTVAVTTLTNAIADVGTYQAGIASAPTVVTTADQPTRPLVVTATKLDQSQGAQLALEVIDQVGNVMECDPIFTQVGLQPGVLHRETLHHVARRESKVSIHDNTPGVTDLLLIVDGQQFEVKNLKDGEVREVNVAGAMRRGNNTITLEALAKAGGSATVLITDK